MKQNIAKPREVILRDNLQVVPDIFALKKVGAGHDGYVFRLENKVFKLLKYDIEHRKAKGLMDFKKAVYFKDELDLKRITKPVDILLDNDGVYTGYVMDYVENISSEKLKGTPIYKTSGDFTCEDLIISSYDLEADFNQLTKKQVIVRDINRGSYIYSHDFIHLCDMDKYEWNEDCRSISNLNKQVLNFTIAKYIYYEILNLKSLDRQQLKKLSQWVKKCANSRMFLAELEKEIGGDVEIPIREFVKYKSERIL